MLGGMSMPAQPTSPIAEFIAHNDVLRAIREWLLERLGEHPDPDTSIAWEDGEEHEDDDLAA